MQQCHLSASMCHATCYGDYSLLPFSLIKSHMQRLRDTARSPLSWGHSVCITSGYVVGMCLHTRSPKWLHTYIANHSKKTLSMSAGINTFQPQPCDRKNIWVFGKENSREQAVRSQSSSSSSLQALLLSPGYPRKGGVKMNSTDRLNYSSHEILVIHYMEISRYKKLVMTLASFFPKPKIHERSNWVGDHLVGTWITCKGW